MAFDPTGEKLDEGQLSLGYWWVTHQVLVRKVGTVLLGIVAGSLFAYASWGFIDWFFVSGVQERRDAATIRHIGVPVETFRQYGAKTALLFEDATILPSGDGRYDLFARATNPNENWMATFDYHFDAPGMTVPAKRGFLLPGETKRIHALGVRAEARPSSARTVISNLRWERVDPHLVFPGYRDWAARRLDIGIEGAVFVPPAVDAASSVGRASFTVVNRTAFSYYSAGFFVTAYAGQQAVGVQYVTISRLMAGERRAVEASWFTPLPTVTRIEVMPDINILDLSVYIAPGR